MEIGETTMENLGIKQVNSTFWHKRKVFVTGHTGFKGTWLCLWLTELGAEVTGYALVPPTEPALFNLCHMDNLMTSVIGDVRDANAVYLAMTAAQPEIVFHLAAQPLVRQSYVDPIETYATNVMGTVHVLEAVRRCGTVKAVVNVTTDKCYDNKEWAWGYRENEPLGGYDPYSSSKACSELVTSAYRSSYFTSSDQKVALASARAGNVIGGGDWAVDRLLPDCFRALEQKATINIRNPHSIRPWQHVLEPLSGYLMLAEKLVSDEGNRFAQAWNFGPDERDAKPVRWIVERVIDLWGHGDYFVDDSILHPHEAHYLKLDCSKAKAELGWIPRWSLSEALKQIVSWIHAYQAEEDMRNYSLQQIRDFMNTSTEV